MNNTHIDFLAWRIVSSDLSIIYRDLCNEILALGGVISAAVVTMEGSILFSGHKEGMHPILSRHESEASVFKAAIRMGTRKEFLEKLGGINYAFAEYGRVNQYTIPLDKEVKTLLLVSEDRMQDNAPAGFGRITEVLRKYGLR